MRSSINQSIPFKIDNHNVSSGRQGSLTHVTQAPDLSARPAGGPEGGRSGSDRAETVTGLRAARQRPRLPVAGSACGSRSEAGGRRPPLPCEHPDPRSEERRSHGCGAAVPSSGGLTPSWTAHRPIGSHAGPTPPQPCERPSSYCGSGCSHGCGGFWSPASSRDPQALPASCGLGP